MYLSKAERTLLEVTLYNLRYDMDCIGCNDVMMSELSAMSDSELEAAINNYIDTY